MNGRKPGEISPKTINVIGTTTGRVKEVLTSGPLTVALRIHPALAALDMSGSL